MKRLAIALALAAPAHADPAASAETRFIVKFKPASALGHAQDLARQGKLSQARENAVAALKRTSSLKGLCFDRFTLGGAETVLRACPRLPPATHDAAAAWFLTRLKANPSIDYADQNLGVNVEQH